MSSKLNVLEIIQGHIETLSSDGKTSRLDIFTFFIIPLLLSAACMASDFSLSDNITSLLVNFGSIFTALLLSVLVLVYDQDIKLDERHDSRPDKESTPPLYAVKKELLNELYYNISYSIICSITLVLACFSQAILKGSHALLTIPFTDVSFGVRIDEFFLTPASVFLAINLTLTIIMVVKRMHILLTTK